MTRVLVTGAAGFLGSHLCERLLQDGHHVVGIDSLVTGRLENLTTCHRSDAFTLLMGDICDGLAMSHCDFIYNLACPASPPRYREHSILTYKTCVQGTLHALNLAAKTGARLLQASTSEVYGDPLVHPQPESYLGNVNPIGPRAIYDEGKRAAEAIVSEYARLKLAEVRIARIFNTYGTHMDPYDGRVVSNFIRQALQGEPLTIYGDGQQTRSFCYVSDLIEGLVQLMNQPEDPGPVNLGNPHEFTVTELAHLVLTLTGSSSPIVTHDRMMDDPQVRRPVIDKAQALFGFNPRVPLSEGLVRTIAYFQSLFAPSPHGESDNETHRHPLA